MQSSVRIVRGILRHDDFPRFLRFCFVGAAGAGVNLSIMYLFTSSGVHYLLSGAIAIESALLFNFFVNRAWTFADVELDGVVELFRALARDHGVRLTGMGVNLLILWWFHSLFGIHYLLSQAVGAGVVAMWNFTGNLVWTWNT